MDELNSTIQQPTEYNDDDIKTLALKCTNSPPSFITNILFISGRSSRRPTG